MTSVVDKYYRRIIQNIDNVRMKFDISSLLVKSKEHDSRIITNVSDISSNLSKINTNVSDMSSNLSLINANKSNITNNYNISQINKKKSEFSTTSIDHNKNNISDNLLLINTNKSNITNNYNISQINKKKSEFNTTSIDNNKNNISSIKNDIENYYKLKDIIIFDIENNINRVINTNSPKFIILKNDIVYKFKKGSYIECNLSILIFLFYII